MFWYNYFENRDDKLMPQPNNQKSTRPNKKRRLNKLCESGADAKWLTTTRRLQALKSLGEAIFEKKTAHKRKR